MRQLIGAAAVLIAASAYTFVASGSQAPGSQPPSDRLLERPSGTFATSASSRAVGRTPRRISRADGTRLIYQSTRPEYPCDQIYTMKLDGIGSAARQHRHRADDVRVLLSGGRRDPVRVDARGGRRVSAAAELRARLRLADLRELRHLSREGRRHEPASADHDARLRRRSDHRARRPDHVHERARRRHGDLHDEGATARTCAG